MYTKIKFLALFGVMALSLLGSNGPQATFSPTDGKCRPISQKMIIIQWNMCTNNV